jgi:putative membrane protein
MGAAPLPRLSARALAAPGALAAFAPTLCWAHHPVGGAGPAPGSWNLEAWLLALLVASGLLYAAGIARLWRRAGRGRGISPAQAARFAAGWLTLWLALVSPIDPLGGALFSAHMVQHELLMVVAAPLLVLGRPLEAWTWGLPAAARQPLARLGRVGLLRAPWRAVTEPVAAWTLHALALWAWHVPAFFEAALANAAVHVLQHTCFLASALLFWWSVFGRGVHGANGLSVASLFTTMMHSGALGALLTFAPAPWYAHYAGSAAYGLTALEDQQLGGLVMWVPGGAAYVAAALAIVARWLGPGATPAPGPR